MVGKTQFGAILAVSLAVGGVARAQGVSGVVGEVPPRVAVVASLDLGRISAATVELYRQVSAHLGERGVWALANDQEVLATMKVSVRLEALGSIAAVDRKKVLRSVGKKRKDRRVIPDVQAMTDTLALDGAVLVDCEAAASGYLNGCTVYYYDRGAARIVAASTKKFVVPIADATRWAPVLVDQMISGLEAHRSAKTRERMEQMLVEGEEQDDKVKPAVGVEVSGIGVRDSRGEIGSLPTLSLGVGSQGDTFAALLVGEYGRATSSSAAMQTQMVERAIGLAFAARSRALESIYWDLGIAGSLVSRVVSERRETPSAGDVDGRQEERLLRLKFSPGLLWQFGDHVQVGPSLYWIRDMTLARHSSGSMDDERVRTAGLGAGMRFQTSF